MELRIKRTDFSDQSTIGELSVNGQFECYTLEDKVRPEKIAGKTAIPSGRYEVVISFSQRFQRPLGETRRLLLQRLRHEALEECLEVVEDRRDIGRAIAGVVLFHQRIIGREF